MHNILNMRQPPSGGRTSPVGHRRQSGFSLVELMVALSIMGIMLALALPSFRDAARTQSLASRINALHQSLVFARSEAVKLQQNVRVDAKAGGWAAGWEVYVDANGDGARGAGETVIDQADALTALYTMSGKAGAAAATSVAFNRQGATVGALDYTIGICSVDWTAAKDAYYARNLTVAASGRADINKGKGAVLSCP